jgi:hypothetical protein
LKEEGSSATEGNGCQEHVRKKEEGRRRENFLFEVTNKENS